MKLCLQDRDCRLTGIKERRQKRKAKSKLKAQYNRAKRPWPGKRHTSRIAVPPTINIDGSINRKETLRFFDKLRKCSLVDRNNVVLDFSRTDILYPPGMLLFVAEVDRIKKILGQDFSLTFSNVKNNLVRQVLIQIGFYDLCGLRAPKLERQRFGENVKHWHFAAGDRVDDDANRAFDQIEGRIAPEAFKGIWKGFSEALVNSVQHGYNSARGTAGPRMKIKRWWMFTQERDGELTVAVCDLGIGIPRSLPLNWGENLIAQIMSKLPAGKGPDVRAVRTALEIGKTRTGQTHRGRGLPQIWSAVRGVSGRGIVIHSNRARLAWSGDSKEEFEHEYSDSIHGTLVMWTVNTIDGESDAADR